MTHKESLQPNLANRIILIAGSASGEVATEKLARAHEFVRLLTGQVVAAGGGLVVYAAGEPMTRGGLPVIFDWTILRALATTHFRPLTKTIVVTSDKVRRDKMTDEHRHLLAKLSAQGYVEIVIIPDDVITGGNIGDEQVERAVAMIALGGGRGVSDRARKFQKQGKVVLPMDVELGAFSEDGEGALGLHRLQLEKPRLFFPATGASVTSMLLGMSLEMPVLSLDKVAERALAAIMTELDSVESKAPDVLILTALSVELGAVRNILGLREASYFLTPGSTRYWARRVGGHIIGVACFGAAGNVDAAAATAELLAYLKPRAVVMVGIAAGMRGKCSLGEVILSERIVAYEGAALVSDSNGSQKSPRPEQYRPSHEICQALVDYLSDPSAVLSRLAEAAQEVGLVLPERADAGDVATNIMPRLVTIGSGEKLIRDPTKFIELRKIHGKIEVAEMEAAGVANACERHGKPYVVVRGISDFGDDKKDDRFHEISAKAAAIVAIDFIQKGLFYKR